MKKFISCMLVCALLLGGVAYAAVDTAFETRIEEIAAELPSTENIEMLVGEAVILMTENELLAELEAEGEIGRAKELKTSADAALDAAGNGAEDARALAVVFLENMQNAIDSLNSLLANGDFSYTYELTEDKTYTDGTYTVTHAAGTKYPDAWKIERTYTLGASNNISLVESGSYLSTPNYMRFKGQGFTISQNVKGVSPGEIYTLSLDYKTDLRVDLKAEFMYYDEETKTYTPLADWAAEEGTTLLSGRVNDAGADSNPINASSVSYYGSGTQSLNFMVPPYANAVKIVLGTAGMGTNNYMYLDNVTLVRGNEIVNNGSFNNTVTSGGSVSARAWLNSGGRIIKEFPATSDNPAVKIDYENASNTVVQRQLVTIGKLYKLTFKYAYSGMPEGADTTPWIEIAFHGGGGAKILFVYSDKAAAIDTETASGGWTQYEAYFVVPSWNSWSTETANIGIAPRTRKTADGNWADGAAVYYDDISVQEVDSDSMIGFTVKNEFTTDPGTATNAGCVYVQEQDNQIQKFVVAKYDADTDAFISAELKNVGEGIAAGKAAIYNIELEKEENIYYKVYLWDGKLTPVLVPQQLG